MRTACLILTATALSCVTAANSQTAPTISSSANATVEKCVVSGTVLRKGTDEPLRFAHVILQGESDEQAQKHRALTGADGKFSIKDIPAGEYHLAVAKNGFVSESYGARIPLEQGLPLRLTPGKHVDDLIFRMTPAAIVLGRVRDENGEPVAAAQVSALLARYVEGKRTLIPANIVITNDLGEYRLFNLAPGKYFLSAAYGQSFMRRGSAFSLSSLDEGESLVTSYYPGTSDPGQAKALNLEAGAELQSIDFFLLPSGNFHIRGHVAGPSDDPNHSAFGGAVMLRKGNARLRTMMPEQTSQVNAQDGSFDISEVAPGSYQVIGFEFSGETPRVAHRQIEVGGADVDGVELVFESPVTIRGHLGWVNKPVDPNIKLNVVLESDEQLFGAKPQAEIESDGSFELKNVNPDTYWVNVTGPAPDAYLKSVQYGAVDGTSRLHVSPGSSARLELTGSARGGHIQGVVTNSDAVPVAGAWVAMLPEFANRTEKRLFQSTRSGSNGKYEFRGIAPGAYCIFSWDNVQEHDWDDAEFLKPFEHAASSITISEGDTKTLDVTAMHVKNDGESPR